LQRFGQFLVLHPAQVMRGDQQPVIRRQPRDDELPDTGVDISLERVYASRFIVSPRYGTRASTALLIRDDGHVQLSERNFGANGRAGERIQYDWCIER